MRLHHRANWVTHFKIYIATLLVSRPVSVSIRLATKGRMRRWGIDLRLPPKVVSDRLIASVFIRAYESAEIRSLRRLDGQFDAVVDLGASCGILGALAMRSRGHKTVYMGVEAQEEMVTVARENVRINSRTRVDVRHAAVFYGAGVARIDRHPNIVATRLSAVGVEVPTVTFAQVLDAVQSAERILLLCDIEGAEWEIVDNDLAQFDRIESAVIEVHEMPGRAIEDFVSIMRPRGLELDWLDGNVVTLVRRSASLGHQE